MKDNPSSANLFITSKPETNYNGEPQPLKFFLPTPISLYRECIYTISTLRLFSETNLKTVSSHNQTLTVLECGTIATIYKYEQTLWSKWVCLAWVTT